MMENFQKISCELVNGNLVNEYAQAVSFIPRSLVLVKTTDYGTTVYNVAAKCRNVDALSVCKALVKAVLAAKLATDTENSVECVEVSKNKAYNKLTPAMSASVVLVTDANGNVLPESAFVVPEKLRSVFRFTKSQPLYKLVVEQRRDWNDPAVVKHLKAWCEAAMLHMEFAGKLDAALAKAADSNETETETENAVKAA